MTEELVSKAIESVTAGRASYCKFLSANDSGETGGHQSGILISMSARDMLFTPEEMRNNHILKKTGKILWQSDYTTNCTFTWYTSKNELRITGFGRGLSPLSPELTGALFVLVKLDEENYDGYLFNTDDSIRDFLAKLRIFGGVELFGIIHKIIRPAVRTERKRRVIGEIHMITVKLDDDLKLLGQDRSEALLGVEYILVDLLLRQFAALDGHSEHGNSLLRSGCYLQYTTKHGKMQEGKI